VIPCGHPRQASGFSNPLEKGAPRKISPDLSDYLGIDTLGGAFL